MQNTNHPVPLKPEEQYLAGLSEEEIQELNGASLISRRKFNILMSGTLLWGFVIDLNIIIHFQETVAAINPIALIVIYLIVAFGSVHVGKKSDNPLVSFAAFSALATVMGMLLAVVIMDYTGTEVMRAFLHTAAVCTVVGLLSSIFPNLFLRLGKGLFAVFISIFVMEIAAIFIIGSVPDFVTLAMILVFAGYFGYDLVKSQNCLPTVDNAVDSAMDIYVDVILLFLEILARGDD